MPSNKRRKITIPLQNSKLSAFAARQRLKTTACNLDTSSQLLIRDSENSAESSNLDDISTDSAADNKPSRLSIEHHSLLTLPDEECPEPVPETLTPVFSTFKPNDKNFQELEDGTKILNLMPGERLVVIGQYEISVHKGDITLLGATLRHNIKYRVFSSLTHALPVIRCLGTNITNAEISLYQVQSGLEELNTISPLFKNLWNDCSESTASEHTKLSHKPNKSSFRILFSSNTQNLNSIQPLLSPPEWNLTLSSCSEPSKTTRISLICGPKSTGKSTFVKLLVNRFLSRSVSSNTHNGVALLDLDPGQPEYSPPGQLSLIYIKEPNFGPPFSHPISGCTSQNLRTHSIVAVSPNLDPTLYKACALDLFAEYRKFILSYPACPLIINTAGWIYGTGMEILMDLIKSFKPTEIIYMSQDGPPEVVDSLQDTDRSIKFITLPSQVSDYSVRTAANLRKMQYISYFHLNSCTENKISWNAQPLTSFRPWEIMYSGESRGVLGIMCYGENPPANLLMEALNGSLVSIVVIDDLAAFSRYALAVESTIGVKNSKIQDNCLHLNDLEKSYIIRTPEDLPYLNPSEAIFLNPQNSYCIGLALVRGIDVVRRRIQVITPISPHIFEELQKNQKHVVLAHGKLDTPGWAYTEQLIQETASGKSLDKSKDINFSNECHVEEIDDSLHANIDIEISRESFQDIPWVEKLEGHQGRVAGSFVWRVRRDLGKSSDGSD